MTYKLVFSDLDGTLLNSAHVVSDVTKRAVKALENIGVPFILATGRTVNGILLIQKDLDISVPFIASNGGYVEDGKGAVMAATGFSKEYMSALIAEGRAVLPDLEYSVYYNADWQIENPDTPAAMTERTVTGTEPLIGRFEDVVPDGETVQKVLFLEPKPRLPDLAKSMKAAHPDLNIFVSNENMMEVLPAGVSKAWGAQKVCAFYGVKPEETVAFGDGPNDIGLFDFCGCAVAMGNAPDAVKEHADIVAATNDDDGLAHCLENLFGFTL